ncbi:tRNA1(Val) (adenine(37)-N6)-methyltransferase [Desulfopila sp. IMCC35006]|uniref:tRNA1(Val) (adenine(37)-N6)-methyltransferase n=1 Tax=Desulfopila sp. IMCC35006 TaxID=2569542 RepID=UPI00142EA801|nr:methyltransferase [Desulfopila sp. IMCC35006]
MIELQDVFPCDNLSRDTLFGGELICYQHQKGYRFSIDSVLLAHFVEIRRGDSILDLGTGSGIIGMILLYRWQDRIRQLTGIEVQQGLAQLAGKNLRANRFEGSGRIIQGDIKEIDTFILAESYDKIVCNPPFYAPTTGRLSKNREAQTARHQILASLQNFLRAAAFAVKNGGEVYFIYPAEGVGECITLAEKYRLEVKKIQFIYSYPQTLDPARLVMLRCCKNGGRGAEVLPPLYVYCEKNGEFTPEMQKYYQTNQEVPLKDDY